VTTFAVPGDPRSNIPKFSEFTIVTDTRPNGVVIQLKLGDLQAEVAPGAPGPRATTDLTLTTIRNSVSLVSSLISNGDNVGAIQELQSLKSFVRSQSGTTIPNSATVRGGNFAGRLISDILTLIFSLSVNL
jgi:hypothetical protein